MRVALVHDWLLGMRGGEKVLEALCEMYPDAEVHTLLYDPAHVSPILRERTVRSSWLNRLPAVRRYYRYLLPLMPWAIESFDKAGYDLVISSSHCVAKGARLGGPAGRRPVHICYCHTPMRYLYSQFESYFPGNSRPWLKAATRLFRPYLTRWDRRSSERVTHFVANSEHVRGRIREVYGRDATVIYPPVDTQFFRPTKSPTRQEHPYYLVVGALVTYKRVDIAIEACRRGGLRLKIIGVGNDERRLRALAEGANVEFLGWQDMKSVRKQYQDCEALLFPQEEDFGIAAVEAMACGKPVIAYGKGGAAETVLDGRTGVLFGEQTAERLLAGIQRAKSIPFDLATIRACAERFDRWAFLHRFSEFVQSVLRDPALPAAPEPKAASPAAASE